MPDFFVVRGLKLSARQRRNEPRNYRHCDWKSSENAIGYASNAKKPCCSPKFCGFWDIIGFDPPRQPMSSNENRRTKRPTMVQASPYQPRSEYTWSARVWPVRYSGIYPPANQTWLAGKSSEKKNPNGANGKIVYKGGFSSKPRLITRGYAFSNSERCGFLENELSLGSGV